MYTDKRRRYVLKVKRVLTPSHQAQSLATIYDSVYENLI